MLIMNQDCVQIFVFLCLFQYLFIDVEVMFVLKKAEQCEVIGHKVMSFGRG